MAFAQKRGRPKQHKPVIDTGTPELAAKRQAGITHEPLDQCFHKQLISTSQHWCGLHLRWLYTLRYGAPGISCRPYHIECDAALRVDAPEWRSAREDEYKEALLCLKSAAAYEAVMGLCVFHDTPSFLNAKLLLLAQKNARVAQQLNNDYQLVSGGLEVLARLWRP